MKFNTKKFIKILPSAILILLLLGGCNNRNIDQTSKTTNESIFVVSREDGSGTRGAFIELTGVETQNANGDKIDNTTDEATIKNNTSAVITTVSQNKSAIGYISLGSMNETVKSLTINNIEANSDNIKNGNYIISRPFNMAIKKDISKEAEDFIDFILSNDGQKIVLDNKYIPSVDNSSNSYSAKNLTGKIVIAGSSSVSPIMEKLSEEYKKINPNTEIEIQTNDSTTGITAVLNGLCDIGMVSRELKDSELDSGLESIVIALDGIAVIVNNDNEISNLTLEQLEKIYTGEITSWEGI